MMLICLEPEIWEGSGSLLENCKEALIKPFDTSFCCSFLSNTFSFILIHNIIPNPSSIELDKKWTKSSLNASLGQIDLWISLKC